MTNKLLLTIPEAAHMLSIGRTKAYQMAALGQIPTVHIGRCVRVPLKSLVALVDELSTAEAGASR